MKILTLTLNPAFDIHCTADKFLPERENHMKTYSRYIGGKGVNISRALRENGVDSTAFVVLGRQNAADFEIELSACGVDYVPVYAEGRIRENITIHPENAPETRISFEGCPVAEEIVRKVFDMILPLCGKDTIFTFNGRLPEGLSVYDVSPYLEKVKSLGAKLVIDSSSFGIDDFSLVRPWLIKPNQEEISDCIGININTTEDAVDAARMIHDKGIENVMVSLGGKGAVLVSDEFVCTASVPDIKVVSTIGAGDSSIAGFCVAYAEGKSKDFCLAEAVAYGSAACLTDGTNPPRKDDVEKILAEVFVKTTR